MNLTNEQTDIIQIEFDNILLINAFAWTWKTTTLVEFCKKRKKEKILYLCYNRWLREEAENKFKNLDNVKVSTIHAIAYSKVWINFKNRLWNLRPFDLSKFFRWKIKYYYWYYSLIILRDFLNSELSFDEYYKNHLLKYIDIILDWYNNYNSIILIKTFKDIWNEILNSETMKVEHDVYLKLFQLEKTKLGNYDYILVDEAQDINLCMLGIILNQKTKKVFIWDSFQQIYQWRWSKNTFKILDKHKSKICLSLTWSFRCSNNITQIANTYLNILWANKEIIWLNKKRTNLDNQTFIWRTNAWLMKYIINNIWLVYYVWWFERYWFDLLLDISYLYRKELNLIRDPFIRLFEDFQWFSEYIEEWNDLEFKILKKLLLDILYWEINIKEIRSVISIEELVNQLKEQSTNDYLYSSYAVTTAHKSKWLEWENVVLIDDFIDLRIEIKKLLLYKSDEKLFIIKKEKILEELNILYVATTRAKQKINILNKYLYKNDDIKEFKNVLSIY